MLFSCSGFKKFPQLAVSRRCSGFKEFSQLAASGLFDMVVNLWEMAMTMFTGPENIGRLYGIGPLVRNASMKVFQVYFFEVVFYGIGTYIDQG